MIKALCILVAFLLMPLPMTFLLKSLHRDFKWAMGYVFGCIVNLTVFGKYIANLADDFAAPSTAPIKVSVAVVFVTALAFVAVVVTRCIKAKKWLGITELFYMGANAMDEDRFMETEIATMNTEDEQLADGDLAAKDKDEITDTIKNDSKNKLEIKEGNIQIVRWQISKTLATKMLFALAIVLYAVCAYRAIAYMPIDGLRKLADVNRLDFFGFVNSDFSVMTAYYLNRLLGIASYNTICVILPVAFLAPVVVLCYDFADTLFHKDKFNVALCFMVEAIMILVGDCKFSHANLMLHGMLDASVVMIILAVPTLFLIGLRFYFYQGQIITRTVEQITVDSKTQEDESADTKNAENDAIEEPEEIVHYHFDLPLYWITGIIMIIACCLTDEKASVLVMMNVIIFALLFIGRRYLPCLQSSK